MQPDICIRGSLIALLATIVLFTNLPAQEKDGQHTNPPGIVIDKSPDPDSVYVGCPSIAILPNGKYVASHSWFGPATPNNETVIFRSANKGKHWQKLCKINGQWWSTLFVVDSDDLIFVSRTAFGNATNCHNANYLTFHRIENFRKRTMKDKPL